MLLTKNSDLFLYVDQFGE